MHRRTQVYTRTRTHTRARARRRAHTHTHTHRKAHQGCEGLLPADWPVTADDGGNVNINWPVLVLGEVGEEDTAMNRYTHREATRDD